MSEASLPRRLAAEFVGSAFLLATVVGSGIMGASLSGGNVALALLGNTLATGAILFVLISQLAPISGAHFNPAVTLVVMLRRELSAREGLLYAVAQLAGATLGVVVAHLMFDQMLLQVGTKVRTGSAQWIAEFVATFGLLLTILLTARERVAASVALYITAAYWFTASTSFANPTVTIARSLSDTFAGIRPADVAPFIVAQVVGALAALAFCRWMRPNPRA
ncbi:MAG: aquaporin family protein [Alphaproteobacteria bacterium]|nr:aquaporin family protein [Alphaproteobacteria bacterium]